MQPTQEEHKVIYIALSPTAPSRCSINWCIARGSLGGSCEGIGESTLVTWQQHRGSADVKTRRRSGMLKRSRLQTLESLLSQ
jgi:hypothetical protein